jgi:hypothetical protein
MTIYADAAGVSIAPANSCGSNSWMSSRNTHRDFLDVEQAGVYSLLSSMFGQNDGGQRLHSLLARVQKMRECGLPKSPSRGINRMKLQPEVLVGKKGMVLFVFDAV